MGNPYGLPKFNGNGQLISRFGASGTGTKMHNARRDPISSYRWKNPNDKCGFTFCKSGGIVVMIIVNLNWR